MIRYGDEHIGCGGILQEGERKFGVCTKCGTTFVPMCESWCELNVTHYICRKLEDLSEDELKIIQ